MSLTISNTHVSTQQIQDCISNVMPPLALITGAGVGSGVIAGLLGIVNPMGGILFGVTAAIVTNVALPILQCLFNRENDPAKSNFLGYMMIPIHCVASTAAAAALVTAVGFPVGLLGAGMLGVASFASMFVAAQFVAAQLTSVRS